MARSPASSPPAPPPFWQTASFRWPAVATAVLGVVFAASWLERVNVRYQAERRLREDPRFGPIVEKLTAAIETNMRTGVLDDPAAAERGRFARALWLGRVREYIQGRPAVGRTPTDTLYLTDAMLLAGTPGRNDHRSRVPVGRRDFVFPGPLPKPGERWLVSVWRDRSGNSAIHHAERCDPLP